MTFITRNLRNTIKTFRNLNLNCNCKYATATASSTSQTDQEVLLNCLSENHQGIAVISLNRPESKNAFSRSLVTKLSSIIDNISHNNDVRVVILRSIVPNIFCAGADLKERLKLDNQEVGKFVTKLRTLLTDIEELPQPVIAAMDGAALGGGLEMALACDIRTAVDNIKMGLVETKLAIIPGAGGTQRLPRILNPALAKELIYTARILNGNEAKEMGLINHVVKQNEQNDAAYLKALEIAEKILPNGPISVRMAKKAIDKGLQVDINTGYAIEEACYAQVIYTKDRIEGLKAFIEKRKPNYIGE